MFFVGISIAFVLLHSLLYLFHRKEPGNLYLAVSALGFAGLVLPNTAEALAVLTERQATVMTALGLVVMILGFIRFGHHFTEVDGRAVFRFFVIVAVVAFVWSLWIENPLPGQIFALLSLVELIRLLVLGARRRDREHSWLVGLGFLAILLSAGYDTLSDLGVLPWGRGGTYGYGMLILFLCLSLWLSWRVADTHRDLERRLAEVESLSAEKLDQERVIQQQELERQLLEVLHRRQREELEAARDLQLSLLPSAPPSYEGAHLDFEMRTASEVGGDFYDYRIASDGSLLVALGDATGHGLDSGLLVVATKGLFHAADDDAGLVDILDHIARGISGLALRRMHMSLLLLRYREGRLELVSAGMPPVLLCRRDSAVVEELTVEAPPLATIAGARYEPLSAELAVGDTLVAMSDGLPERLDTSDGMLGYEPLSRGLGLSVSGTTEAIRAALFATADQWSGGRPREDDETVVVLRRSR